MFEYFQMIWATPGLGLICAASFVSGIVYGFAGFGAALIFMPIALAVMPAPLVLSSFGLTAFVSLFTVMPRAWPLVEKRGLGVMLLASFLALPVGVWLLGVSDPRLLQLSVSGMVLLTLVSLVLGYRLRARPSLAMIAGIGALAGFTGGATGMNGPPVILFHLSGDLRPERMRANTLVFLSLSSVASVPNLWLQDLFPPEALGLGVMLALPYMLGNLLGQRLFDPGRERLYRWIAYGLIALAALGSLSAAF
ncbi:MAG: sulfite exporter TauE/SafE family protein [Mangrovicoccus sp.]